MEGLNHRIRVLNQRYEGKLVCFGDFNLPRDKAKQKIEKRLSECKGKLWYEEEELAFTRIQKSGEKINSSYLDYFLTKGVTGGCLEVTKPIGKSDHLTLQLTLSQDEIGTIQLRKDMRYNFSKCKKDSEKIKSDLLTALSSKSPVPNLRNLIKQMRDKYKARLTKKKNIFQVNPKIKEYLSQETKQSWDRLTKIIGNSTNEEYHTFMAKFEDLKLNNNMKEYFLRLRFYSDLGKRTDLLKDLVVEGGPEEELIDESFEINKKVVHS